MTHSLIHQYIYVLVIRVMCQSYAQHINICLDDERDHSILHGRPSMHIQTLCVFLFLLARMLPQVRQVTSSAPWRGSPLSHAECLLRIMQSRGSLSPLLTAPWVTSMIFRMDWLHIADLGVAPDFLGNFFHA